MKKNSILLIVLCIACLPGCAQPVATSSSSQEIDVLADPVQIPYRGNDTIKRDINQGHLTIFLKAHYTLSGMVVSTRSYPRGWRGQVAPIDVAVVWGELSKREVDEYISYSQRNRWYYWRYRAGCPYQNPYIIRHSSNNHIIPANDNILLAVKAIKNKEKAQFQGYLVNVKGAYKGGNFWWNSSTTRNDTGDASCEVFYVTKVTVSGVVYE